VPFSHDHVRLLIDEDLPATVAQQLRSRGYLAESLHDDAVRKRILARRAKQADPSRISDTEVAEETGQTPSVLVTLNLRDYSDPAQHETLVERHSISVVQVRVPKKESAAVLRPAAIHDIVHRWAHRFVTLEAGQPTVATATRSGVRRRDLEEIREEQRKRDEATAARRAEIAAKRTAADERRRARAANRAEERRRQPEPKPVGDDDERLFGDDG